jgi:hypothetical protein
MSLTPVFFPDLLADRKLKPAAVELHFGEGDAQALLPLIEDKRFAAFAAALPCLIGADLAGRLSAPLLGALQSTGCRLLADDTTERYDAPVKPVPPPATRWLAGNWYLAPPASTSGHQAASRALSLKLLQRVAEDADTCEIEAIFRQDPVLAYHLLRLVNSLGVGAGRHISSFSQAILILGRQQLKRWLNLMLFAASRDDHRSAMLLARTALRARRLELLARACGLDRSTQEKAFLAGMFSLLGTLFGLPLTAILTPLKLNASLSGAVLDHEGELGRLLQIAEYAESADQTALTQRLGSLNIAVSEFNLITLEASQWMLGVINEGSVDGGIDA